MATSGQSFLQNFGSGYRAATDPQYAQQREQEHGDRIKFSLAPLSQALQADQERLKTLVNQTTGEPPKQGEPGYDEFQIIHNRMADTIGQMRGVLGQKPGGPNAIEAGTGNLLDKLHITNHLKAHVQKARADAAQKYQGENTSMAQSYATGALPYGMTPEGQAQAQKTTDALKLIQARNANAGWTAKGDPVKVGEKWFQEFNNKAGETKLEPLPDGYNGPTPKPETEYQRSLTEYRNKMLALQEARQRAANDPNSPAAKTALLRAEGEAEKSHAYMIRALASAKGTDLRGNPLPGALETQEGEPIGSMFSSNFYKSAQGMAQLNDAQGAITQVGGAVDKLYASGGSLANPNVASALANPEWTAAKLMQGIVGQELSPEEREAVVAIRSAQENIQGMRKAAGGGLSNEQVNRLEAQLPGPNTPDLEFAQTQLEYLNLTLSRLSQGVPSAEGGATFQGPEGPVHKKNMAAKHGGWSAPNDAPAAPKEDGKFLKADGKVIAKSRGGQWVQP